jgi:hypothetical protein
MQSTIRSLQDKLDEQRKLLDELRMWGEVQAQGISPEDVAAFTLKEEWIPKAEQERRRRNAVAGLRWRPDPWVSGSRVLRYNAVRLKDGSYKQLNPAIRRPGVGV